MDNRQRSPYRNGPSYLDDAPRPAVPPSRQVGPASQQSQPQASNQQGTISIRIPRHPLRAVQAKARALSDTKLLRAVQRAWPERPQHAMLARLAWGFMALLMLSTIFIDAAVWRQQENAYALSPQAQALIPAAVPSLAESLTVDNKAQTIEYNKGYTPSTTISGDSARAKFTASFSQDPVKGVTITDPISQVTMGFKPKFDLKAPQANQNRVVYPITGRDAQAVFTAQAVKLKEDIILNRYQGDKQEFSYELSLDSGLEAQIEPSGAIGIYGADSNLLGNITAGSDADAKLLDKARKNAAKTNLLFSIPAPFIKESGKQVSKARAWYGLKDNVLTIYAEGLKDASYPLTIDPSVYVETASKLMRGNNESNIDFDVDNELIQKGKTTGGRFDAWVTTGMTALPSARWNHSTVVAGGYVYVVGGNDGSSVKGDVYWAHINNSTGLIEQPNPGSGACASWCTNSAYNLPSSQVRQGGSLVAYNGYLYLFGGLDSGGSPTSTVYISKLGANGEPQLWHPTDSNKNNWVYWYSDTALSSSRAFLGAVAYNNRMYVVGGSTTGLTGGVTTVQKADVNPIGTLSNWTTTGMSQLSTAIMSHSLQTYNDYLYVIGGISTTTTQSAVLYSKINTDGTINTWQTGNPIGNTGTTTARAALGGKFATIWGGYIYVAGGCSTVNASGYCTSIANDIQLASINADGSVTDWTTVAGVTNTRMGYGLVAWRNSLYGIGGCAAQNTSTGACTSVNTTTNIGEINPDGDVSTVSTSVPNGTSPCVSAAYYNCDLPPQGDGNGQAGGMSGGAIINNGYIYYIGGCTAVGNNSVCFTGNAGKSTDNIAYAAIDSVGHITRVASCAGSFVGSWCAINPGMGAALSAFGYAVFNNTMYIIGGTSGTQWQSNVWRATFNSDGTWGSWSSQTFAAVGLGNAKGYQYVFTRANPGSASTYPGNLYVLGGCSGVTATDDGLDCTGTLYTEVYKCYIKTDSSLETSGSACTTSGQLQIDSETTAGSQGLGVAAGTVYANYVYLIGGQSPNESERGEVLYAKIDNSNNIVAADGGSVWVLSPYSLSPVRRRGTAFGYNGYLYALAGYNVSAGGSLNDLLYAKINVSDGSISAFQTSSVTVTARWDLRSVVNNGYVYAIGGCSVGTPPASCTTMTSTVQTFQLYNNYSGSPKSYSNGSQYATDRYGASAAVVNGYIYLAGGCTTAATDCTTATTSVESAPINAADGTIGTWTTSGVAALPAARTWGKLMSAGGTLYYVGGQASGATAGQTSVYYATPGSGTIGSWTTSTGSGLLPAGRTQFGAAVWHDRLYIVGGLDASSAATATIYVSSDQAAGGAISSWGTSSTNFNVSRSGTTAIAYANNLYIFGGYTGTYYLNDGQFASIGYKAGTLSQSGTTVTGSGTTWTSGMVGEQIQYADGAVATITGYTSATSLTVDISRTVAAGTKYVIDDGSVNSWNYTTSLPSNLRQADGFAANGFIYLFGGRTTDTTCISNTIVAPISANTTIATGNNPTGIGEWYATNIRYSGSRYGAAAAYSNGKAYVLGGQCNGTMITTTNRVQYSAVQAQPQIARYSRMIDTDTDVFPTKWLMNGLDNSTGARWFMRYRSSTAANASWGQDTNFGEISLGVPQTYTPKDGSGTNTSYARYYYMIVTIDSQNAYGYPEDVTRGPTIADLSLFYTADPSKRLIHGKTFTGGEQQPLDTPF